MGASPADVDAATAVAPAVYQPAVPLAAPNRAPTSATAAVADTSSAAPVSAAAFIAAMKLQSGPAGSGSESPYEPLALSGNSD